MAVDRVAISYSWWPLQHSQRSEGRPCTAQLRHRSPYVITWRNFFVWENTSRLSSILSRWSTPQMIQQGPCAARLCCSAFPVFDGMLCARTSIKNASHGEPRSCPPPAWPGIRWMLSFCKLLGFRKPVEKLRVLQRSVPDSLSHPPPHWCPHQCPLLRQTSNTLKRPRFC